jgi:hypothetical protein
MPIINMLLHTSVAFSDNPLTRFQKNVLARLTDHASECIVGYRMAKWKSVCRQGISPHENRREFVMYKFDGSWRERFKPVA